jgi:type IX secretion system PorP/SprF family membrane protein
LYFLEIKGQDIHFSQFFASPLNTNPANSGNFDGDYRLVFNNKNQWQSFADAYKTFALSFDASFTDFILKKSISGVGLQINTDIAGAGNLMTNQLYLNLAYYFPINKDKNIFLGIGLAPGYVFQNIDFNKLTFGSQYQNNNFNPDINPDENFRTSKINYFDFGGGLNFFSEKNPKFQPYLGFSVFHLTQPHKSFSINSDKFLPIKYMVSGGINWQLSEKWWIEPMLIFMFQQKYSEYNFGGLIKYEHSPIGFQTLYFGFLTRAKDAAIICFGGKYNNIRVTINYDINFSKLTSISKGKGGFELSVIYIISKKKTFVSPYYRKCPDFM